MPDNQRVTSRQRRDLSRQPSCDDKQYTLTVDQAADMFADAGIPKSPRTIMRYCKTTILQCAKSDSEDYDRYLISLESVDKRIRELQLMVRPLRRQMSRHDATVSGHVATPRDSEESADVAKLRTENTELAGQVKKLEIESFDLKVTNRAREQVIEKLDKDREHFIDLLRQGARQIGQLETRLRQLEPPKERVVPQDPAPHTADIQQTGERTQNVTYPDFEAPTSTESSTGAPPTDFHTQP